MLTNDWIIDRRPTATDGHSDGDVLARRNPGESGYCHMHWSHVGDTTPWKHCRDWQPPVEPLSPAPSREGDTVNEAKLQKARDEELDACVKILYDRGQPETAAALLRVRRPPVLSDKQEALNALSLIMSRQKGMFDGTPFDTIRAVLEQLKD